MKSSATKKKLFFLALVFGGFFFTLKNGSGAEVGAIYLGEGADDNKYGAGARAMKGTAVCNGIYNIYCTAYVLVYYVSTDLIF